MLQTSAECQAGSRSLPNWSLKCNPCQVIYITNALLCELPLHSPPLERFVIQEHRGSGLDFSFTEWKEECFQVRPVSKIRLMSGVLLNCSQTNSSLPLPASVTPYKGQCEETPKMGSIIVCKNFCMVKNNLFLHCLLSHFRLQISQYTTITTVSKHCCCWNVPQLFIYLFFFFPPFGLLTVCGVFEGCRGVKMPMAGFQWWVEVSNSGACLWNRNLPAFTWHLSSE